MSPLAFFALPLANELSTYCVCGLEDWEANWDCPSSTHVKKIFLEHKNHFWSVYRTHVAIKKDLREWKSSVNLAVKKNQEQVVGVVFIGKSVNKKYQESQKKFRKFGSEKTIASTCIHRQKCKKD